MPESNISKIFIEHNEALVAAIHAAARPVADQIEAFAADVATRIDQFKARLLCDGCAELLVGSRSAS